MNNMLVGESGNLTISDEALSTLVSIAAKEIEGVSGLKHNLNDQISNFFSKNPLKPGIKVESDPNGIVLDINMKVAYGNNVTDIASKVQRNIKQAIESMLNIKVAKVNIHVVGLDGEK